MTTLPPEPAERSLPSLIERARSTVRAEPDRALALSRRAAHVARSLRDMPGLVAARSVAADALLFQSRPLAAARVLRRLATWHAAQGDAQRAQGQRLMIAQALIHADHLADADSILDDVEHHAAPGRAGGVMLRLHALRAALEFRRERPRAALAHYRHFHRIPKRPSRGAAIVEMNTANSLSAAGRPRAALRRFQSAREALRVVGAAEIESNVDQNEAYAHLREGDLGHALLLFDRALDAAEDSADLSLFPALCLDRAELFLLLSMPDEARGELVRLRLRVPRLTELDAAHQAFVGAFALFLAGRHAEAARGFCDVASDYQLLAFPRRAAHCRILAGRARLRNADLDEAEELVARAREVLTAPRDPRRVSADLLAADVARRRGDLARARACLVDATAGHGDRLPPWMHLEIARTEAEIAGDAGDRLRRRAALYRAADALDGQLGRLPVDEYLIPFLGARTWLFEGLAADHLEAGEVRQAFEALERGRARALLELLGAPTSVRASLGERRIARRRRELGVAELQLHEAVTRADGTNPEQVSVRASRLADTRRLVPRSPVLRPRPWTSVPESLDAETTLVEFAWIADHLHAFVVRQGSVRHRELGIARDAGAELVERLAFQFWTARTRPNAERQMDASRRALEHHLARAEAALWTPLRDLVKSARVVIIPTEYLHLVPFHAFVDEDVVDGEPRSVAYAPSAGAFVTPRDAADAARDDCTVFALADSDAPEIAAEARDIAGVWPETTLVRGSAATRRAFRDALETSRIVHVATHGVFDEDAPLFTSLRLADAWVNAYDVYGMRVDADLVVLAACETARSVASRDADLLGLVRAFLVAGAGHVLAPQWPVADAAARIYVTAAFAALRDGATPALAARAAAEATRAKFPHPADWAGWFAYGRGGRCRDEPTRTRDPPFAQVRSRSRGDGRN